MVVGVWRARVVVRARFLTLKSLVPCDEHARGVVRDAEEGSREPTLGAVGIDADGRGEDDRVGPAEDVVARLGHGETLGPAAGAERRSHARALHERADQGALLRGVDDAPRYPRTSRALVGRGYGNESLDVPTGVESRAATTEHGRSARSARSAMERAQPREDDREDIPTHASACGRPAPPTDAKPRKGCPPRRRRRWDSTSFVLPRKWEPQRRRLRKFLPRRRLQLGCPPRRAVHFPFTLRDGVRVARTSPTHRDHRSDAIAST